MKGYRVCLSVPRWLGGIRNHYRLIVKQRPWSASQLRNVLPLLQSMYLILWHHDRFRYISIAERIFVVASGQSLLKCDLGSRGSFWDMRHVRKKTMLNIPGHRCAESGIQWLSNLPNCQQAMQHLRNRTMCRFWLYHCCTVAYLPLHVVIFIWKFTSTRKPGAFGRFDDGLCVHSWFLQKCYVFCHNHQKCRPFHRHLNSKHFS